MRGPFAAIRTCLAVCAMASAGLGGTAAAADDTYLGAYNIVNEGTGRCLDAFYSYGGGNGNPVGLWTCNGGVTEAWHIAKKASDFRYPDTYAIRNARNSRSLDYPASSNRSPGFQYELWDYFPTDGQVFWLMRDGSAGALITNAWDFGGFVDAFASDGGGDGNRVGDFPKTGSPLQHWTFDCVGEPCLLNDATLPSTGPPPPQPQPPAQTGTPDRTCDPRPPTAAIRVRASFGGHGHRTRVRVTRYGQRLQARATVTRPDGSLVGGVPVCVVVRTRSTQKSLALTQTVTTDGKGQISYALGRGPSRRVDFIVRAPDGAATDALTLKVHAPVTLRLSRHHLVNGQTLTFRGTVPAGPRPAAGVVVGLEVRRGARWQTFANVTTRHAGRFRFRYRFTRTTSRQSYAFRARVLAQAGYAYDAGSSKTRVVVVNG